MSATVEKERVTERVGRFEFEVRASDEPSERWERRSDALAAWRLAEWERERREAN